HLVDLGVILRDAEGAGHDAVGAADAAWLEGALRDAVRSLLDRIRRADAGADGVLTVHADLRRGLDAVAAADRLQVDHGAPAVGIALLAGLDARLAPDAARVVDEERQLAHRTPPAAGSSRAIGSAGASTFVTRT